MDNTPAQFVNWKLVTKLPGEKPTKVPCGPDGRAINHLDPANWMTEDAARATGLPVAFVFTENDPYFFIDLDNCRDPVTGAWDDDAVKWATAFDGDWMEISQSGTGMHIVGRCDQNAVGGLRNKWGGKFEFYTKGRFMAMSGHLAQGDPNGPDRTMVLAGLVPARPDSKLTGIPDVGPVPEWNGHTDDTELVRHMVQARGSIAVMFGNHAPASALWNGDAAMLAPHYPPVKSGEPFDRSSADAALVMHLGFWTGKDFLRTERLWRAAPLTQGRDKLDRDDYVHRTITTGLQKVTNVYQRPDGKADTAAAVPPGSMMGTDAVPLGNVAIGGFLTTFEVERLFSGCIYIMEDQVIMNSDGVLMNRQQFKDMYGGYEFQMQADGSRPTRDAWEAFTQNRSVTFPKVLRKRFFPDRPFGEIIGQEVNAFKMPDVVMSDGDVKPYLDLLRRVLPDERDRTIFLSWCAAAVQHRGKKAQWATVLQGCEGNGKTFLMSCVEYGVGLSVTHRPNPEDLQEKFNTYVEGNLFIAVEEVHMEGRRDILDRLKKYLTNNRIEIRGMQKDKRMADNLTNWMFLTNYKDAVLKSRNDRRYAVFFTAQQDASDLVRDGMDGDYFPKLWEWVRNGGYAAIAGYLMRYEIPAQYDFTKGCHRAPETSSTGDAVHLSLGAIEQDILDAIEQELPGFRGGWISSIKVKTLLDQRRRHISNHGLAEALRSMGYYPCRSWPRGRAPTVVMQEGGGRPVLYCTEMVYSVGANISDYNILQGYEPPQMNISNVTQLSTKR